MKIQDLLVEYETHTYTDDQGNVWRVNDEGDKELVKPASGSSWQERPAVQFKPKPKMELNGIYFFDIKPEDFDEAEIYGMKKFKSGKYGIPVYNTSGKSTTYRINIASQKYGKPTYWSPNKESMSAGATGSSAVPSAPGKGRPDSLVV